MRFSIKLVAFMALPLMTLVGCDRFLKSNGTTGSKDIIKVQTKEFLCLKPWPGQLKAYFEDRSTPSETAQIFSCVDGAVDAFERFAKGEVPNQYSREELREFINRYMLADRQISENLMLQLMKLKGLLLGGSNDVMTHEELLRSRQFIKILAEHGKQLDGHWKILLFDEDPAKVTEKQLADLQKVLFPAVRALIDFSKADNYTYSWNDFTALMDEAEAFMDAKGLLANLKKWVPLTGVVRTLFLGEGLDFANKEEWREAGLWTANVHAGVARVFYRFQGLDLSSPQSWSSLIEFADLAFELLKTAPQFRKDQILKTVHIDRVIDEAMNLELLPKSLNTSLLKQSYRQVLGILKQGDSLSGPGQVDWKKIEGFDLEMMANLKVEYQIWKLTESQIIQNFAAQESLPIDVFRQRLSLLNPRQILDSWNLGVREEAKILRSWDDWLAILNSPYPLSFVNGTHLLLKAGPRPAPVSAYSASLVNTLRSVVRFIEMGYGRKHYDSADIWDAVLTSKSVKAWESDFREMGRAINFLDPRKEDAADEFYRDARFFTFSSHGQAEINSQQVLELLSLMVSGGKVVTDQFMNILKADNCLTDRKDLSFHLPMAEKSCFERSLKRNFSVLFANLPNLLVDVKLKRLPLDEAIQQLESIAQDPEKPEGYIEYGEIRTMTAVIHYLESLILVYDTNHDQFLSQEELLSAFPRFESVVGSLSPMGNWFTEDAYLYLVYRSKKPETDSFGRLVMAAKDFASFMIQRKLGLPDVPRINLLKVIAVINNSSGAAARLKLQQKNQLKGKTNVQIQPAKTSPCLSVSSLPESNDSGACR